MSPDYRTLRVREKAGIAMQVEFAKSSTAVSIDFHALNSFSIENQALSAQVVIALIQDFYFCINIG